MLFLGSVLTLCTLLIEVDSKCPQNLTVCQWTSWGDFGSCSRTCGQGSHSRRRGMCCKEGQPFDQCLQECGLPNLSWDTEACNMGTCSNGTLCQRSVAEIIFVLDSSGSVGYAKFNLVKSFVQNIIMTLDIDQNLTRVGVLKYNERLRWHFKLADLDTKLEVLRGIEKIAYKAGSTNTSGAIEEVYKNGFTNARPGVPKIAVVITDGLSHYPSLTRVQAKIARSKGIKLFAIGIGDRVNQQELWTIASEPEEKFLFNMTSFDALTSMQDVVAHAICEEHLSTVGIGSGGTTLAVEVNTCMDAIPDCEASYGRDMCTDYRDWARGHCALYCGFCKGPPTTPAPCVDDPDTDCTSFGQGVCTDSSYIAWVMAHCRKFCGVCKSTATTTLATTTKPTPKPLHICKDKRADCESTYKSSCSDPGYEGWLRDNCEATCGFCNSTVIVQGKIVNGVQCDDWNLPAECTLEQTSPDCCPLPRCPDGYPYEFSMEHVFP